MGKILCATRGGESAYRTQDAAIALAKERGDRLVFLYVVDLHFLDKTAGAVLVDVESEMRKMGEFLLVMAKERAAEQDIAVETICHRGDLSAALKESAQSAGASLIVLGRPVGEQSVFVLSDLEKLAVDIEAETGVETRII